MAIITEIALLMALCIAGSLIAAALPFPFPSSVAAMLLLFVFLLCKWIKVRQIETVGGFLLRNMPILFVPSGVSILESLDVMKGFILKIIIICSVSTVLTFLVSVYTVQLVIYLQNRRKGGANDAKAG